MSYVHPEALVSTDWLADHLDDPHIVLVDASFTLPGVLPTASENYAARHIPGAVFFDVDHVADQSSALPHMLPSAGQFEQQIGALGISNDSFAVIYDTPGLMSAGRLWWTLRVFGHDKVGIVNGGLKKWIAEARALTDELPAVTPAIFHANFRPEMLRDRASLLANLESEVAQVIDARPYARFSGQEKEARPGLRSGHIPGSLSLPSSLLTDPATGEIRTADELAALFGDAGLNADKPVITSCGSGVTACALGFALHLIGREDVAIYDGSWAEWGREGDTPVATG